MTNNRAERGGEASEVIYSIVETAIAKDLHLNRVK